MKKFVREKKIYCGDKYMEVKVFPYTENQVRSTRQKRRRKEKISEPKQKNLNEKNSREYFVLLANGNFGSGDFVVHLTYSEENLPPDYESAMKIVETYLRRIRTERKRRGLPPLKYANITQYGRKADGTHRIHHHIFMNGGLDRDTIENLWFMPAKNRSERVTIGWANCRRLQPNKKGISQMAGYMAKDSAGKKRYTTSKNLERPFAVRNDSKYSRKKTAALAALSPAEFRRRVESEYNGYSLIEENTPYCVENILVGWCISMKFYKKC